MSRGQGFFKLQGKVLSLKKKFEIFQKPLDNGLPPWYNNNVRSGTVPQEVNTMCENSRK
jgi:hypothetical protein